MQGSNPLEVRLLDANDTPAMLDLFHTVFGHAMSPALHAWKYPEGSGHAAGVFRNGELIAHYGGVGNDIFYFGRPARAVQVADVMVKASARIAVRKGSAFFLAASTFLEHYVGHAQPYLLGYGFPNDRVMTLAERLGLYAPVGRMWELRWPLSASAGAVSLLHKVNVLNAAEPAGTAVVSRPSGIAAPAVATKLDALWLALRGDLQQHIVVKKDAAHISRRYLQHPDLNYRVCLLSHRLGGRPLALIVLKHDAHKMVLMDYVGALANLPLALSLALREAANSGCTELSTWCSEAFVEQFRAASALPPDATALPITTPANIWTPGPQPAELHNHWWLLPGDTDFL